ncbi:UNVERIFIED_CONTAM: putative LRR receptor-like serine/threonine-protein kinase [Sesamum calycinum]|uniref:non-specific serine/threonine protein kinase n=1 Tax=Sesamum calycinum TaxID=2727403 RepID=A0AAW2MAL2_9LAMI
MGFSLTKRASNRAKFLEILLVSVLATLVFTSDAQLLPEDEGTLLLPTIKGSQFDWKFAMEFANLSHLRDIDLSRNYLNGSIPAIFGKLRLVTLISWCLKPDIPCSRKPNHHSLFINCGGRRISFEGNEYEENLSGEGPSHFESYDGWAYSSTGVYMGNDNGRFIATNVSSMASTGAEFYQTARLSPSSLKYFGLCLRKGSYKVRLHFAEIMYSDDATFSSLGRRKFDVSIQGQVVLTDFDIVREANGVRKGTTAIPDRGVYGPLISAIAVTPNFDVSTGLSVGAITGIVISSCVFVLLILAVVWMKVYRRGKAGEDSELRGLDLQTGYFTLRQIKAATNNFDNANKIGEGGFGPVYKGVLSDGTVIAVKQLSSKSKQGNREFVNEIGMISALQPRRQEQRLNLDWQTRKKICLGIARGLAYLHEESRLKIVHRDIKATNVLLDKDLNAKISDFGLAKLDEEENTHISTRIAGTIPPMSSVVSMLEGKIPVQAPLVKSGTANDDIRFKAFEMRSHDSQTCTTTFSQDSREQRGGSMDGPWIDSSLSLSSKDGSGDHSSASRLLMPDLYNVNLD